MYPKTLHRIIIFCCNWNEILQPRLFFYKAPCVLQYQLFSIDPILDMGLMQKDQIISENEENSDDSKDENSSFAPLIKCRFCDHASTMEKLKKHEASVHASFDQIKTGKKDNGKNVFKTSFYLNKAAGTYVHMKPLLGLFMKGNSTFQSGMMQCKSTVTSTPS